MSRTYRSKPSSNCYMRRQRHKNYKTAETAALLECKSEDVFSSKITKHLNRMQAYKKNAIDPWDYEKIISHYRGQKWHRDLRLRMDIYSAAYRIIRKQLRCYIPYSQLISKISLEEVSRRNFKYLVDTIVSCYIF